MPLDPISALSLAAAVVQFIDFARTIVCKTNDIYHATNGILPAHFDTKTATERLVDLSRDLELPVSFTLYAEEALLTLPDTTRKDVQRRYEEMNNRLQSIRSDCYSLSQELLDRLSQLEIPPRAQFRRWKSFRMALKSVWGKNEINGAATKLDKLRSDLDTHVLAIVRETQTITFITHDQRFRCLSSENQTLIKKLSNLQEAEETNIERRKEEFTTAVKENRTTWTEFHDEFKNQSDIYTARQDVIIRELGEFKVLYQKMAESAVIGYLQRPAERIEENILGSLRFAEMNHRYDDIPQHLESTCEWALRGSEDERMPRDGLADWFARGSGLYWIQGKAASGKSTVMKYLWDSETTAEHLDLWRGAAALTSAMCFLWQGGIPEQRNHAGLLRTLLYTVLKWRTELISEVFNKEWALKSKQMSCSQRISQDKWSLGRLKKAFEKLVTLSNGKLKMCFLIDGLDEYDGDAAELAEYISAMSEKSIHAKFCVSSRPWPVFEDIFNGAPGFKVQDFNRSDINCYIQQTLAHNSHWVYLSSVSPSEAKELREDVLQKADGVFLWVVLVMRSLVGGLRNGDEFSHLRYRLHELPAELEDLFDVLMGQIGSQDRHESSKIFQIFRAARQQLDLLTLERALRYNTVKEVLDMPITDRLSSDQMATQTEATNLELNRFKARINSRTAGMLETPSSAWSDPWFRHWETRNPLFIHVSPDKLIFERVSYLHRTVKDYLERPEVWSQLVRLTGHIFEPNRALMMGLVVEAKTVGMSLEAKHLCDAGLQLFGKAAQLNGAASQGNIELLEHMDKVLTHCALMVSTETGPCIQHWSNLDPWDPLYWGNMTSVTEATSVQWYPKPQHSELERAHLGRNCGSDSYAHAPECSGAMGEIQRVSVARKRRSTKRRHRKRRRR